MIVYDLSCRPHDHRFEGWFASADDFESQRERGLLTCPQCGSGAIERRVSAPAVPRKGNSGDGVAPPRQQSTDDQAGQAVANLPEQLSTEAREALTKLADMQNKALEKSQWVGNRFAEEARAMHYGEKDADVIHGTTSVEEAKQLAEEGVAVAPLPFPVVPPEAKN